MGAAGDGAQPKLGNPCGAAAHTPESGCLTSLGMGAIAGRLALQPCQTVVDAPTASQNTADMGQIKLVDASIGKQSTGASQGLQARRQQQHTGRVSIQAMHQTPIRSLVVSLHPGDQGIGLIRAQARLRQQPRGLVDRQEPTIPIQHSNSLDRQGDRRLLQCFTNNAST